MMTKKQFNFLKSLCITSGQKDLNSGESFDYKKFLRRKHKPNVLDLWMEMKNQIDWEESEFDWSEEDIEKYETEFWKNIEKHYVK